VNPPDAGLRAPWMEAAGIEPAPGSAKPSAESRPYLAIAWNDSESLSHRIPCRPVLSHLIPQAPATYVQHGGARSRGAVVLVRAHVLISGRRDAALRARSGVPGQRQARVRRSTGAGRATPSSSRPGLWNSRLSLTEQQKDLEQRTRKK